MAASHASTARSGLPASMSVRAMRIQMSRLRGSRRAASAYESDASSHLPSLSSEKPRHVQASLDLRSIERAFSKAATASAWRFIIACAVPIPT